MWNALLIFVGGGLGSLARWWFSGIIASRVSETFPWGTLCVNFSGSFLIGLLDAVTGPESRWLAPSSLRPFLMIGICGGYTTFSSFSLETLRLVEDGDMLHAGANVIASVVSCLFAVWLGHLLGAAINSPAR